MARQSGRRTERPETAPAAPDNTRQEELHRNRLEKVVRSRTDELRAANRQLHLNIRERKRVESALRESEANFRALADNADEAIVIETADGQHYYNPCASRLFGYSRRALASMRVQDLIVAGERPRIDRYTRARLAGRRAPSRYETAVLTRSGREVPVEVTAAATVWQGQTATIGMLRDISKRKAVERALQASESRYRAIVEDQTEFVCRHDGQGRLTFANDAYCRYYGLPRDAVEGKPYESRIFADDRREVAAHVASLGPARPLGVVEHRVRLPGGEMRWQQWTNRAILDEAGRIVEYQSVGRDITERVRLEHELLNVSQRTQQRIGWALHDALGQELTGIAFLSKALQTQLAQHGSPEAAQAGEIARLVSASLAHTRRISRRLAPVDVSEGGLSTALHKLAKGIADIYGIACACRTGDFVMHDNFSATHVYFIAQEAIANAVRHGKPSRINLSLSQRRGWGRLTVSDNGAGFASPPTERCTGMGLQIMQQRVKAIGGKMKIQSRPRSGARIVCMFRLAPDGRPADTIPP